jgi:hypothetical protein
MNFKFYECKNGNLITDQSNGRLDEIIEFADRNNLREHLDSVLDRLTFWMDSKLPYYSGKTLNTNVYHDFAPLSLFFTRTVNGESSTVGGVIFHGKHDNGGDGSAPTFSVSLDNDTNPHWQIHT